jgi:glycosyltransferase involved in cell wall biosynthesis
MKKTLIISDSFPLPECCGSHMRTMNLVRYFASLGPVEVAYHEKGAREGSEKDEIFSARHWLQKLEYPMSFPGRFGMLIRGFPYPIREYGKASKEKLFALIESGDYDYVLVRYLRNTGGLFGLSQRAKSKVIIDIDDVLTHSLYDTLFAPTHNVLRLLFRTMNKVALAHYQSGCVSGFGACLVCSEKDKSDLLGEQASENVFVVPNTLSIRGLGERPVESGFSRPHVLAFVGSLCYRPNVNGLLWFLENVYPVYRNVYPNAVLLVVGRSPLAEVIDICARTKGVELHPDVPDIIKYYRECRAIIVPLLEGSGTRLKVLEAALLNRPIISTRQGVEGLDVTSGVDFLEFEDGPTFCEAYRALSAEATYDTLMARTQKVVLEKYSDGSLFASMSKAVSYIDGR